jgi:alkaline phosphatase D
LDYHPTVISSKDIPTMASPAPLNRRRFLQALTGLGGGAIATTLLPQIGRAQAPALITHEKLRPKLPYGVMSGDVTVARNGGRAIVWSRSDRPAQMLVDYALDPNFKKSRRILGGQALAATDFTARVDLSGLPTGEPVFYRVMFRDLDNGAMSDAVTGRLNIPSGGAKGDRDITFIWSGDSVGQGWGINPDWGGLKLYSEMLKLNPDFMIHSGDTIYADGPLKSEVTLKNGSIWKNIVTPEKSKVAETLQEFRGNYIYPMLDAQVRRFNSQVPMLVQWDDHEVTNNWYPGEILEDDRYQVKDVSLLAARGRQAFLEYMPIRFNNPKSAKVYRSFNYGPNLDIFMLDMRSYRAANSPNQQPKAGAETAFLGSEQIRWIKQQLAQSKATWKIIASDMPLGLIVRDGKTDFENLSNGDGPVLGREFELANLLQFINDRQIQNVVWLTADVHYAAAHYYDPNQAQFQNFRGFWEFVAGPIHAGTFGPGVLDNTFGPQLKYQSIQPGSEQNLPPSDGQQFFGTVKISGATKDMTVTLRNLAGETLYSLDLPAV